MSDMWTAPEDDPRIDGHPVGELATYREYLTSCRLTIELTCADRLRACIDGRTGR